MPRVNILQIADQVQDGLETAQEGVSLADQVFSFITTYWWILPALILLWMALKWYRKEPIKSDGGRSQIPLKDLGMIVEIGMALIIIYLIQKYLFYDHSFFILAILIFTPIMFLVYYFLDQKNDYIIIESTIQGEILIDLGEIEKKVVPTSRQRIIRISEEEYKEKDHIGDQARGYWDFGRVIFCDYYDNKTLFHPEIPGLRNIAVNTLRTLILHLKDELPGLYRKLELYELLGDYKVQKEVYNLKDIFPWHLKYISDLITDPVKIGHSKEELLDLLKAERKKDLLPDQARDEFMKWKELQAQEGGEGPG